MQEPKPITIPRPRRVRLRRLAALAVLVFGAVGAVIGYYAHLASKYDMAEVVAEWHPNMVDSGAIATTSSKATSGTVHAAAPKGESEGEKLPTLPRVPLRYAGAVPYEEISESFRLAIIAREDRRFDSHPGVDLRGILRAAKRNVTSWEIKEGGSTITQQLTRNVYHLRGRSFHRKLLEAMIALRVERHYSKEEILTHYANRIYFGDGHWGIAAAARAYFDKAPKDLNLSESAVLAGMIRSPHRLGPTRDMTACLLHWDQVLRALSDLGWASKSDVEAARAMRIVPDLSRSKGGGATADPARDG